MYTHVSRFDLFAFMYDLHLWRFELKTFRSLIALAAAFHFDNPQMSWKIFMCFQVDGRGE